MTHSDTRKLYIVKRPSHLELCILTECLTNLFTVLGNTATEKFESGNVVCQLNIRHRRLLLWQLTK